MKSRILVCVCGADGEKPRYYRVFTGTISAKAKVEISDLSSTNNPGSPCHPKNWCSLLHLVWMWKTRHDYLMLTFAASLLLDYDRYRILSVRRTARLADLTGPLHSITSMSMLPNTTHTSIGSAIQSTPVLPLITWWKGCMRASLPSAGWLEFGVVDYRY